MTEESQNFDGVNDNLVLSNVQRRSYSVARKIMKAFASSYLRLDVVGADNIPNDGGFILAPGGHRSYIDTPIITQAMKRQPRFIGADVFFNKPLLGWFLYAMGGFPVERGVSDRVAMNLAEEILSAGEALVMFPEGARFEGPVLEPLKTGIAFLSCRAQVPIVPVGLGGLERVMGKGILIPRPRKCSIVVGEPMWPPHKEGKRVPRSQMLNYLSEVEVVLQHKFDQAQDLCG